MVKITNGVNIFEVTRGAFDGIYSRQGYVIFNDTGKEEAFVKGRKTNEKTDDERFVDEMIEKPISSWTNEEVKRFAALNEISLTGTKSANEAKEIIKSFIEADSQE